MDDPARMKKQLKYSLESRRNVMVASMTNILMDDFNFLDIC